MKSLRTERDCWADGFKDSVGVLEALHPSPLPGA